MKNIILLIFLGNFLFTSCSQRADNSPIEINWRTPSDNDLRTIGPILGANGITGCGSFYVGSYKSETKIACTSNGVNFAFYDIWESIERVNITPIEVSIRFNKPEGF